MGYFFPPGRTWVMPMSLLCSEVCHNIHKSSQGETKWRVSPCFLDWIIIARHCYFGSFLQQDGTRGPSALKAVLAGIMHWTPATHQRRFIICLSFLLNFDLIWARCWACLNHSGPIALKRKRQLILAEALASDFQRAANLSTLAMCRSARLRGVRTQRGAGTCSAEMFSELCTAAGRSLNFAFLLNSRWVSPKLVPRTALGNE